MIDRHDCGRPCTQSNDGVCVVGRRYNNNIQGLRMRAGIAGAHASGRAGRHSDEEKGKKL